MKNQAKHCNRNWKLVGREEGQGLTDLAVGGVLLMILLLAIVEMAQVFRTYVILQNSTREAALYAAANPLLTQETVDDMSECDNPDDDLCSAYVEAFHTDFDVMGQSKDFSKLTLPVPGLPNGWGVDCPVVVNATYQLYTFSSQMQLPFVGRMGLPDHYSINYTAQSPIRDPIEFNGISDPKCD